METNVNNISDIPKTPENPANSERLISLSEHENALRTAVEKERHDAELKIRAVHNEYMIGNLLGSSGAKNPDILRRVLNIDQNPENSAEELRSHISARIEELRASDPYLFEDSSAANDTVKGSETENGAAETGINTGANINSGRNTASNAGANANADSGTNADANSGSNANANANTASNANSAAADSSKISMFFTSGAPHGSASPDLSALSDADYYRITGVICF